MGTSIEIAPLTAGDESAWRELFAGYNEFYERTLPEAITARAWAEFAAGSRLHARGAKIDGRLVGIVHFFTHPSTSSADVCYLQDLFTAPDARGQGVGRALIGAATDWAREQRCHRIYWLTQESNATARRLYDQLADNSGIIVYRLDL